MSVMFSGSYTLCTKAAFGAGAPHGHLRFRRPVKIWRSAFTPGFAPLSGFRKKCRVALATFVMGFQEWRAISKIRSSERMAIVQSATNITRQKSKKLASHAATPPRSRSIQTAVCSSRAGDLLPNPSLMLFAKAMKSRCTMTRTTPGISCSSPKARHGSSGLLARSSCWLAYLFSSVSNANAACLVQGTRCQAPPSR